ncbi:MAG: GNAT family N-acetyltransferase [Paracoccaceae bacterium]
MQGEEISIRLLGPADAAVLDRVADEVFDGPVRADWVRAFLDAGNHLIAVAVAGETVVAMATGVIYVHPDKPPQLWVNEVATDPAWQRRGLATRCLQRLLAGARARGCAEAWLATETDNAPARALYRAMAAEETEGIVVYGWRLAADAVPAAR